MMDLDQVEYLTFDCYGTLIDWERGMLEVLRPLLASKDVFLNDDTILEAYAKLEEQAENGPYVPYRQVLSAVIDGFGDLFGFLPEEDDRISLIESVPRWPPFSDAVISLERLGGRFKLVVVSNIDDDLFGGSSSRLGDPFHRVFTAQQIGSYKPAPANFEYLVQTLSCDVSSILHVAQSLFHDIAPANELGLSTVWINRRKGSDGFGATPPAHAVPSIEFESLSAFADYLDEH
jgi:2-haloacid dehalogenase